MRDKLPTKDENGIPLWHALCKKHLNELYEDGVDVFTNDADQRLTCDYPDCAEKAVYELYPELCERLESLDLSKAVPYDPKTFDWDKKVR